jgi:hypothetical protein
MIQDVLHVVARIGRMDKVKKPWLLVGKGPTLDRRDEVNFSHYNTFTLNHACCVVPHSIAHFTDLEAFAECAGKLYETGVQSRPSFVCLPWYPHVNMRPGMKSLRELVDEQRSFLHYFFGYHVLLSYNSTLATLLPPCSGLCTIPVRSFSAVAGFNILAQCSANKEIFTLGIDGGIGYCADMNPKDRLANGQSSFDIQFKHIRQTCQRNGVKITPLFTES